MASADPLREDRLKPDVYADWRVTIEELTAGVLLPSPKSIHIAKLMIATGQWTLAEARGWLAGIETD